MSQTTHRNGKTLLVIGAGPGIGRAVATLFAAKHFTNVGLLARRKDQLNLEQASVQEAAGSGVNVKTYAVDVADSEALNEALDSVYAELGQPECVFYNAARVVPSPFFKHDVAEIEYDFKIAVSALYLVAQSTIPHLVALAKDDPSAKPALIVTSSHLPVDPIPALFALSLTKAAQKNLVLSLHRQFAADGVHIGVVNVAGTVSPTHETRNPRNIAEKAWGWYELPSKEAAFELEVR